MIRAHLASYPKRQAIMLEVIERVAPQVDQLFLILNEYQHIPRELVKFRNLTVEIPKSDLKDIGKFYWDVAKEDFVALIDDDFAYPPDYIRSAYDLCQASGLDRNIFGYLGLEWKQKRNGSFGWKFYATGAEIKHRMGVEILGTGVTFLKGQNAPPFAYMKDAQCYADIRFAKWMHERALRAWTLPKPADYLPSILPVELAKSAIFESFTMRSLHHLDREAQARKRQKIEDLLRFRGKAPHLGKRFESYHRNL